MPRPSASSTVQGSVRPGSAPRSPIPSSGSPGAVLFLAVLVASPACGPDSPGAGAPGDVPLLPDLAELSGLPDEPRATASSEFWEWWGDGRAELSGYRVTTRRYGELREGQAILVYVTEPHDRRTWIKDDLAEAPHRVEVLKLIRAMEFLTGVYPYYGLTAAFSPVDRWVDEPFHPVRVNLDVQEWCGTVAHRLWTGTDRARSLRLSYFAGEGETMRDLALPPDALYEDALPIQLRELDGPFHEGREWTGVLVPELWSVRTRRAPLEPLPARITRSEASRGDRPVTRFTVSAELDGGREYRRTVDVEREEPRRILGWELEVDGAVEETADLRETRRLAYWELNRLGDETLREDLGLRSGAEVGPPGTGSGTPGPGACAR